MGKGHFWTSRDRIIAFVILGVAIVALGLLRPLVARYNDAHLLRTLVTTGRLKTFIVGGSAGQLFIQTASSNGHIVTMPWTAIIYREEGKCWIKMEKFNYHRTYFLAHANVADFPDIAVLANTPTRDREAELRKLGFSVYCP